MLPREAVKEFKELFLEIYKIELLEEEASYRANNLFNLYEAVYDDQYHNQKINPKNENRNNKN